METKEKIKDFKIRVLTRHPSYVPLKSKLPRIPFRSVVRFGSTTEVENTIMKGGNIVEINTVEGVKNSASKILMKKCFTLHKIPTANWYLYREEEKDFVNMSEITEHPVIVKIEDLPYPIVAKHEYGSKGRGNYKLDTQQDLEEFLTKREADLSHFLYEKFIKNMSREYRLHITSDGCFYTCRKLLKSSTPEEKRWIRNDSTCVWILDENILFDKPINWDKIVESCVEAQKSLKLDICGFDVRVQSAKNTKGELRENPSFAIIESGTGCSLGEVTTEKYLETLPKLITKIAEEYKVI